MHLNQILNKISHNYHIFLLLACIFFLNKLYIYDKLIQTHHKSTTIISLDEISESRDKNKDEEIDECYLRFNKTSLTITTTLNQDEHGDCDGDWISIDYENDLFLYNFNYLTQINTKIEQCFYSKIQFKDDFNYEIDRDKILFKNASQINNSFEFLMVQCTGNKIKTGNLIDVILKQSYKSIFQRVPKNKTSKSSESTPYNVLFIGLDSISKDLWLRELPKTSYYLLNTLNSTLLRNFNIIGDGTPAALIPLLTGHTEQDLPNTLKGTSNAHHVDEVYPFIWKYLINHTSLFAEDWPQIGTFQYRMIGMKRQPTHHYMRPFQLAAWNEGLIKSSKELCLSGRRRGEQMLDYSLNFAQRYANKGFFGFTFIGEYSHDKKNHLKWIDHDLEQFLMKFKMNNLNKNTFLIVFSDHGPRFSDSRASMKGLLEERTPFFSIFVPDAFKAQEQVKYETLVNNSNKLVTPFDVHKTLAHLFKLKINTSDNSISLFSQIPINRTCKQAKIDSHWCACMKRTRVRVNEMIESLADHFINYLNEEILSNYSQLCSKLYLKEINRVHLLTVDRSLAQEPQESISKMSFMQKLLSFMNAPTSKHVAVEMNYEEYQIQVTTEPNLGIYEFTIIVQRHLSNDKVFKNNFKLDLKSISRVNKYGSQASCITDEYPELRKYCFCKT